MNHSIVEHADPGKQLIAFGVAASVFIIVVTFAVGAYVVARASSPFAKACVALAPGTPAPYFEHSLHHAGADGFEYETAQHEHDLYASDVSSLVRATHQNRFFESSCIGEFDEHGALLRARLLH